MRRFLRPSTALALTVTVSLCGGPALAVDFVTRTPNVAPVTLADPGSVDFVFNHRIPSITTVSAYPTLFFDIGVLPWLSIYSTYASKGYAAGPLGSAPVQGSHDLGVSLRQAILSQGEGGLWADAPVSVTLSEGASAIGLKTDANAPWYSGTLSSNSAQQSLGLSIARTLGPVGLIGTVRSNAYQYAFIDNKLIGQTGIRTSGTLGATLKLTPYLTLAGDFGKYFDHLDGIPAWSAAIQGQIPQTAHLVAFEVTNVPTATLAGASQAAASINDLFMGFAFSVNFKGGSRWSKFFTPEWLIPAPKPEPAEETMVPSEPAAPPAESAPVPPVAEAPPAQAAQVAPAAPATAESPVPAEATPAPAPTKPPAPVVDTALIAKGKKLFDSDAAGQGCAGCHEAKDLAGASVAKMKAGFKKDDSMADFRTLKDADLKALEAYLKTVKK